MVSRSLVISIDPRPAQRKINPSKMIQSSRSRGFLNRPHRKAAASNESNADAARFAPAHFAAKFSPVGKAQVEFVGNSTASIRREPRPGFGEILNDAVEQALIGVKHYLAAQVGAYPGMPAKFQNRSPCSQRKNGERTKPLPEDVLIN